MDNAHFFFKIHATEAMEFQTELLLKSIQRYSGFKNFYCTIMVPKDQIVKSKTIRAKCQIIKYTNEDGLNPPWSGAIRFLLKTKAEVCFLMDVDTLVAGSLVDLANKIYYEPCLYGVPALVSPLSSEEWKNLYEEFDLTLNSDFFTLDDQLPTPFYVNYGFLALHSSLMEPLGNLVKKYVYALNSRPIQYKAQVALSLAISESQVLHRALGREYNYIPSRCLGKKLHLRDDDLQFKVIHYCHQKHDVLKSLITPESPSYRAIIQTIKEIKNLTIEHPSMFL